MTKKNSRKSDGRGYLDWTSSLWCCIISGSQLASLPLEKGRQLKEVCGEDLADFETRMRR
jgi:hypothetical protein